MLICVCIFANFQSIFLELTSLYCYFCVKQLTVLFDSLMHLTLDIFVNVIFCVSVFVPEVEISCAHFHEAHPFKFGKQVKSTFTQRRQLVNISFSFFLSFFLWLFASWCFAFTLNLFNLVKFMRMRKSKKISRDFTFIWMLLKQLSLCFSRAYFLPVGW